jgi:hypothetical protein
MTLLQNRKNEGVNLSYIHEAKLQIEAMIELCREGEISVYDAERIIGGEWFTAVFLEDELAQDIDDLRQTENHRMKDVVIIQEEIDHVQKMLGILAEYIVVLENDKTLSKILLSDDYKLKRKAKIKTQGIIGYEDKETPIHETAAPLQNPEPPVAEPEAPLVLPPIEVLEKLANKENSVLRSWHNGKYKCKNLRQFVDEYAEIKNENPTKHLILDYLVKEKDGKHFEMTAIVTTLNTHGVAPEKKKAKGRQRTGTHKKDFK